MRNQRLAVQPKEDGYQESVAVGATRRAEEAHTKKL